MPSPPDPTAAIEPLVNNQLKALPVQARRVSDNGVKPSDMVYLASANATQMGDAHYLANKTTYWKSYPEYASRHPEVLSTWMTMFIVNEKSEIFDIFPIKVTNQARLYKNTIKIVPDIMGVGTRKVPGRQISFTIKTTENSAVYSGQGFSMDYTVLRTDEGPAHFDTMVRAVIADMWAMVIYTSMCEFQSVPSGYTLPDQLYPFDEVPSSVDACFSYRHGWHGMLNKAPQNIHRLVGMVSRIFARNNNDRVRKILTTSDCANFVQVKDQTNMYYDKSGSQAITNRGTGNLIGNMHGVQTIAVQLLEPQLHSDNHDTVLKSEYVTGGMAGFPERCQNMRPEDYRSHYRHIRMSSWSSNKMETYSFNEFLHHCPEFIALHSSEFDYTDEEKGGLNVDLLFGLAKAVTDSDNSATHPYTRTRTRQRGNEEHLSQFLRYAPKGTKDNWYPVFTYGEISECHLKSRHLRFPYKTMECAILDTLSDEDKRDIEAFVATARTISAAERDEFVANAKDDEQYREQAASFAKLVTRLCEINKGHTVLQPAMAPREYMDEAFTDFDRIVVACWNFLVRDDLSIDDLFAKTEWTDPDRSSDEAIARLSTEAEYKSVKEEEDANEREGKMKAPLFAQHNRVSPLSDNSSFMARWNETKTMSLFSKIAARAVLLQAINLRGIDSWTEHNVAIPLGGTIFRPFESQFMESMIMLAADRAGNLYFSGLDNTISFDPGSQHFHFQMFAHFMPDIDDTSKFYVAPYVRGLQILGGKGNKYINDDRHTAPIEYFSERWQTILEKQFGSGEKLGDFSIIPVLQPYSHAIDNQFAKRHYDTRGFWYKPDFVTLMDNCGEFMEERNDVMYPNQFLTNHVFPFTNTMLEPLPNERASYIQMRARQVTNSHVHQTTQDVFNPHTMSWEEINDSHPWGRERDNIVQVQNSTRPVGA